MHRFAEAEQLEGEALVLKQKLVGDAHPDVGRNLNALGQLIFNRKISPHPVAILKATLSIQRKLIGDDDRGTLDPLDALGKALDAGGKYDEAEAIWREDMGACDVLSAIG